MYIGALTLVWLHGYDKGIQLPGIVQTSAPNFLKEKLIANPGESEKWLLKWVCCAVLDIVYIAMC